MTYYFLFHSIHDVLRVEKALKEKGFSFELVPVPRNLSSDCGSCIRVREKVADVTACMRQLDVDRCYSFDGATYLPFEPD